MDRGGQALDDPERLAALRASALAGEVDLEALERISRLVARLLRVPTALVNLVEDGEQRTVAGVSSIERFGTSGTTSLDRSFCHNVVTGGAAFVVSDARGDERVADHLAVTEGGVLAYYGVPLRAPGGEVLGALCAVDEQPRGWTAEDSQAMEDLGAIIADELDLRAVTREIERLLNRDALTGLGNRRLWEERAPVEIKRAQRLVDPITVVAFDLDGFKAVNDRDGHAAGDALLRDLGARWEPLVRAPDVLVRWGGDEFVLMLVGTPLPEGLTAAERLKAAIPEGVGVSYGVAQWQPPETLEALVARADAALYEAKRARPA